MKFSWLQKKIDPPMEQSRKETSEHSQESQHTHKEAASLHKVEYPRETEDDGKSHKGEGTNPPKPSRTKRLRIWIKRNFFNAMLTLFTAMYAVGFLFDAYITKRAYIARGVPGKRAMKIIPGDLGVKVDFYNIGQTPIRKYVAQGWLLKEKEVVPIENPSPYVSKSSLAPRYSFEMSVRWVSAIEDLVRIRNNEIGIGILLRIYYQDAFYIWHCEEFAHTYDSGPDGGFTLTGVSPVCDASTKQLRFNRVCVPSADRSYGVWVETWESFRDGSPPPSPDNDPTPCQRKKDSQQ